MINHTYLISFSTFYSMHVMIIRKIVTFCTQNGMTLALSTKAFGFNTPSVRNPLSSRSDELFRTFKHSLRLDLCKHEHKA